MKKRLKEYKVMNSYIERLVLKSMEEHAGPATTPELRLSILHSLMPIFQKFGRNLIKEVMTEVVDEVQYEADYETALKVIQRVTKHFDCDV